MSEIIFVIEEAPEGGYTAMAVGESIYMQADDLGMLKERVRDAVRCHFDEGKAPDSIRFEVKRADGSGPKLKDNLVEFVRKSPLMGAALDIRRSRVTGSNA